MKLEFIEMEGFRGFLHRVRFDIPPGFLVIVGRNGVGKSTILDAVDFALTGTINKFDVERARGGGLLEHLWWVGDGRAERHFVSVGFVDGTGSRFVVTRYRDKPEAEGLVDVLCRMHDERVAAGDPVGGSALMKTTLFRDEFISASSLDLPGQQRFNTVRAAIGAIIGPDHSERTGKILAEAKDVLSDEQGRLNMQQAELGRLLAQLTEARTEAAQSSDISEALKLVAEAVPNHEVRASAEEVRRMIADRRAALANFNRARARSAEMSEQRTRVRSDAFKREMSTVEEELQQANLTLAANQHSADLARRLVGTEEQSDLQGSHFAALLEHGSVLGLQEGHCPLCEAVRTDKEFAAALDAIRNKLAGQAERLRAANQALLNAEAELRSTQARVANAARSLEDYRARLAAFETADLAILGASTAVERVSSFEQQINRLREQIEGTIGTISDLENAVESARQIDSAARSLSNEILMEQFETVLPLLKELYQRLRPHTDWTDINIDFGGRVRGSLNFSVGDGRNPQFLFSSGERRAAGLAFLLAVHLSRPWCRWQSLLLDDPVQHVDDYRALNLVEVLAAIRRSHRQIVVAVEDAALADLLCRRLRSSQTEPGRRYDLAHANDGSAKVDAVLDVLPLTENALPLALAS